MHKSKEHRAEVLATRPWTAPSFQIPEHLKQVPTMLTSEECRMLAWLADHFYSGEGKICELGPFMGGSTVHLAQGLAGKAQRKSSGADRNSFRELIARWRRGKPIHSFDTFYLAESSKQSVLDYWHFPPFKGTDLFPLFRKHTAEFKSLIQPHKGDVKFARWSMPIEILFVDCCKDWSTNDVVARKFYPSLVPGKSIIVQQDYLHFQHPWLIATMEALYPRVKPVAYTVENSMIFACYDLITSRDIEAATGMSHQLGKVKELIQRAQSRFPDPAIRRYIGEHLLALEKNPSAKFSWDLHL